MSGKKSRRTVGRLATPGTDPRRGRGLELLSDLVGLPEDRVRVRVPLSQEVYKESDRFVPHTVTHSV